MVSNRLRPESTSRRSHAPREPRRAAVRLIGWALLLAGVGLLSWLAWFTLASNSATKAAQTDLLEQWLQRAEADREVPVVGQAAAAEQSTADGPVALLSFVRPPDRPLLHDRPLAVVAGVTETDLIDGPGHYPGTALPGQAGNMAIAGHRTTYGSPFGRIDELDEGDEIHLEDRAGDQFVYRVVEQRIVAPEDVWVVASDPLGRGRPTLTLTTCHPRFSNEQRLVVFAELVGP